MNKKKILFVNGSYNEIPLINAAHELGLYVITSGNDPSGDGHKYSDEYIKADYSNKDLILDIAKKEKIDYICSCGNDFGATTSSYVADKLLLPGHDKYETCLYFHEKDSFKKLCYELGLSTPLSFPFNNVEDAISHLKKVEYPQIIKPSDLGGGKGVEIVNNYEEGVKAIHNAYHVSKLKTILIEDYIKGEQHGFTCFIKDKKVKFVYYTDDYSYLNPYMVWVAIPHKKDEDKTLIDSIVKDVELVASKTSMADGYLTIQLIVRNGKPYYIETMRRCLGNMHYRCLGWDLGIDAYKLFVANEIGSDTSSLLSGDLSLKSYSAFLGLYASRNGKFKGYKVNDKYKNYLKDELLIEKVGYEVTDYLSQKLGMLFFTFNTLEERDDFIKNMRNVVLIEMEEQQ